MSEVLTPIERRIYNYLVDYLKRETFQPSIREIGTRFGIRSTKTVTEHLQSLQRKGYLDRTPSRSRALKILGLNLSPETYTVPLFRNGYYDSPDEEEVEARFDLDRAFGCTPDCFLVRVSGAGLGELGILEGDLVLVEPTDQLAGSGVAVFEKGGTVELRRASTAGSSAAGPSNGQPSENGGAEARLLGVARAVLRTLRQ
jgi:repressor LexA